MKFKFKKGSEHKDCQSVSDKIIYFINNKVSKGFFSKKVGHYTDNLHKSYVVEVIIKEVKK